ncbi:EamA family transporter RarD [Azotosporobacter soli]|uniref:EamA family transporter RarD n=1 Tax=Azotosporobacter soli TaxID=3055040 RepID=UPI0031FE6FCF
MKQDTASILAKPGLLSIVSAYILWGALPIYWKLLTTVPAMEVLAHRIVWSFFFLLILLLVSNSLATFRQEIRFLLAHPKHAAALFAASLLISANWLVYIWAVQSNRIVESSLGYYINPLVSIALGLLFLKERLTLWQGIGCLLALSGVLHMTWQLGSFPWISLFLAVSFGLYGLCKKVIQVGAVSGIALETLLVSPLALFYLTQLSQQETAAFSTQGTAILLLCIGTGAITATPLLLFASGVKQLPLKIVGFIQYLSPTLALMIGVFVYGEPFSFSHLISFAFIWSALLVVSLGETSAFQTFEKRFLRTAA